MVDYLTLFTEEEDTNEPQNGVKIDGQFYAYANPEHWSLRQRNTFGHLFKRLEAIQSREEITEDDEAEYETVGRQFIKMIVPSLPDDIVLHLSETKRTSLGMDFLLTSALNSTVFRNLGNRLQTIGQNKSPNLISTGLKQARKSG